MVVLYSGWKMPVVGLGTVTSPLPPQVLTEIFINTIKVGYRHFDTASLYRTEETLGRAIAQAIDRGLIRARDDLFITSKLWCTDAHPDLVLPAINKTLENLRLDYLDLYLIHFPVRIKNGEIMMPFNKDDLLPFDMKETWEAMEECCRLGLSKSIGVSNSSIKKLSQLLTHATIPPAVNQVEMNPSWNQKKLREFCIEKEIHVTVWSPLAANGAPWGSMAVMENPILKDITMAKGKSIAQVSLRWIYEQGASAVVKSFNKKRMKENLQIFNWELNKEEINKICQIMQKKGYQGEEFVSDDGMYKSVEEFWDGEI